MSVKGASDPYILGLIKKADEYAVVNLKSDTCEETIGMTPIMNAYLKMVRNHECVPTFWTQSDLIEAIVHKKEYYAPTFVEPEDVQPFVRILQATMFIMAHLKILTGQKLFNMSDLAVGIFIPYVKNEYLETPKYSEFSENDRTKELNRQALEKWKTANEELQYDIDYRYKNPIQKKLL